jgi:hypothetical protein
MTATEHGDSVVVEQVFQFVQSAFQQDRLRDDLDAVFRWASNLPEDLDLLSQRAFLVLAKKAVSQAIVEVRSEDARLARQVPKVVRFMEDRATSDVDNLVNRLTERIQPLVSHSAPFAAAQFSSMSSSTSIRTRPLGDYSSSIGKADLDRIFDSPVDTNISDVGTNKRFASLSKGQASKLKKLRHGGMQDD